MCQKNEIMKNKQHIILALLLVIAAALSRLADHPMNFTPITGIALFSAFVFEGKWKLIVPFAAILLSDIALELSQGIGFHNGTALVYSGFALMIGLGYLIIKNINLLNIVLATVAASTLFFLLTNFALFYPEATTANGLMGYPHTMTGVVASYTAGLPFFKNMLMGDLIFTGVIFSVYSLADRFILNRSLA